MTPCYGKLCEPLINEFVRLLKSVSDDRTGMYMTLDFLNQVLRYKCTTPPTIEIMEVLRQQKPILFQFLKQAVPSSSPIHLILQLRMDYPDALKRLGLEYLQPPVAETCGKPSSIAN